MVKSSLPKALIKSMILPDARVFMLRIEKTKGDASSSNGEARQSYHECFKIIDDP